MELYTFTGFLKVKLLINITTFIFLLNNKKKRLELWNDKSWFSKTHSAFSIKKFLANYNISALFAGSCNVRLLFVF